MAPLEPSPAPVGKSQGEVKDERERGKYRCGPKRMTLEMVLEVCRERKMWGQPQLNTQLFLNYKGFETIENLEDFFNVRALHLGNNNIARIDGLSRMSGLRTLYLESNRIQRIENLESNLELRHINLEGNALRRVEGLSHLTRLEQLNLASNNIEHLEDLEGLREVPSLVNVDVSNNHLEASDGVVEFWEQLPNLKVLRFHGNPGVRNVPHYRKRLVNALEKLSYLDERPVFPVERKSCAAWAEGGMEAMQKAKQDFHRERHQQCGVDPDRRELLTQRRLAAVARLDREAREREAAMEEMSGNGLDSGDPGALADYERSWKTKVNLHGLEGTRAKVAEEAKVAHGRSKQAPAPAASSTPQTEDRRQNFGFAPPARDGGAQAHAVAQAHGASSELQGGASASGGSARSLRFSSRTAEPSDFRVTSAASASGMEAADRSLDARQMSVFGDDPWAGSAAGKFFRERASAGGRESEAAVPQIWEAIAGQQAQEEAKAMEQNFCSLGDTASASRQNELELLD